VADTQSVVPLASDGPANVDAPADADDTGDKPESASVENKRRDRRIASRIPATLWCASRRKSLTCAIRDKSSSGARLEFAAERLTDGFSELVVGDKLSLVFNASGAERASVACVVVWIAESSCGVRFSGQFSQINAPRKTSQSKSVPDKTSAAKSPKSTFSVGALRRPFSQAD
jgi:PilZ domain-containing protein